MRVLVCGGRKFYNKILFKRTLDLLHERRGLVPIIIGSNVSFLGADAALIPDGPITCIIQGGASGADFLGKHWAIAVACIPQEEYKMAGQGRSAGPQRNAIMLKAGRPDLVLAFGSEEKGTRGRGTNDMVKKARSARVAVMEVKDD